jgi:hypothetical protein
MSDRSATNPRSRGTWLVLAMVGGAVALGLIALKYRRMPDVDPYEPQTAPVTATQPATAAAMPR